MNARFSIYSGPRLRLLLAALVLAGCGGGGDGDSATPTPAAASARPVEQSDLQIAQAAYGGTPRTPAGFHTDPLPSGHANVSTTHLKNVDLGGAAGAPAYELCTDDWNEALSWSEAAAQNALQYAGLMETNQDARFFEFGRLRPGEPEFYTRSRVFKCAYLDRSATDLRNAGGPAGRLNLRPLTAAELRSLSEYLWQFTIYNNFGHAVLKSSGTTTTNGLSHTLHLANLVRSGTSAGCDRIDVEIWVHTVDASSGHLHRDVQPLWSFGARESAGVVQLCP